jgi:site-specific DNA-methyltransferase (adenine-specific)
MGKDWDKALPPREAFGEMYRVLKPGALAFVMSSPRQDLLWRMMSLLESVGFELRQSPLYWAYASGFPKAYDVGKGIDRKARRDYVKVAMELGIQPKSNASWRDWTIGEHSPSDKYWEEFKKVISEDDWKRIEREIIGKKDKLDSFKNGWGVGYTDYDQTKIDLTKPATPEAKRWDGWKSQTGLKPAVEVILMVNKPFSEKTIVDNVLKHGTGAVNVDACLIPFSSEQDDAQRIRHNTQGSWFTTNDDKRTIEKGRFPANLLVSDDVLDDGKISGAGVTGSGVVTQKNRGEWLPHNVYGERKVIHEDIPYLDKGGFSRYFSLDAWWMRTYPFLVVPKASKSERDEGLEQLPLIKNGHIASKTGGGGGWKKDSYKNPNLPRHNFHPTVKPLKLMTYLVTLGCPKGGVVLDPFVGSGTTLVASYLTGMSCIGVEIEEEYCVIADAKMRGKVKQKRLDREIEYSYEGEGVV